MTEYDLFAAIGDIDERFIRLSDVDKDGEDERVLELTDDNRALQQKVKRRVSRRFLIVALCTLCLAVFGTWMYWQVSNVQSRNGYSSVNENEEAPPTASPTSSEVSMAPTEPMLVDSAVGIPYVIIENLNPTEESIRLEYDIDYVKVECTERYAYKTGADIVSAIYVPADLVSEFIGYDMLMIRVKTTVLNDRERIFMPASELHGKSEYLPFVDGRIRIDTLQNYSFVALQIMNEYLDIYMDCLAGGGETRKKDGALPKKKLTDGMTLQEVIDYLDAYNRWSLIGN